MNKNETMLRLACFCEIDQFDEAILFIDELIENRCDYSDEAFVYVACKMNENKTVIDKAYHLIRKGLALFPENLSLKTELCLNLQIRGFQKDAMDLCRQLTEDHPFSAEAWYLLSELYYDCGDYTSAVDSINYAITCALDEDNSEMNYLLLFSKALYLFKNGSYFPAINCFHELMSFKEYEKAKVDHYLAECYMRLSDYETAFRFLNGIIGEKEKDDEIAFYGNLIFCCLHTGRQIVAVDLLADALKLYPNGILEYITALNTIKNYQSEMDVGDENIINSGELARNYFIKNIHYN